MKVGTVAHRVKFDVLTGLACFDACFDGKENSEFFYKKLVL